MKAASITIFILFFVALPVYLLSFYVMPQINALEQTYANSDRTAQEIARGTYSGR